MTVNEYVVLLGFKCLLFSRISCPTDEFELWRPIRNVGESEDELHVLLMMPFNLKVLNELEDTTRYNNKLRHSSKIRWTILENLYYI